VSLPIEPFKIKAVEPIRWTTREQREKILAAAHFNMFAVAADDVIIDLLTDSGTNAMSARQWAALMEGDESYAGSRSYDRFRQSVQDIFSYEHVIPTHQGRAAERLLFRSLVQPSQIVPNNTHFDTTRANLQDFGGVCADLVIEEGRRPEIVHPFKGNMDIGRLDEILKREGTARIPFVMLTLTNNSGGGQPVSMENVRGVSEICRKHGVPLYFDACRFAENAYFIKIREQGYADKSPKEIARELFSYGDGCIVSAKKDAIANIGGIFCTNDPRVAERAREYLVLTEGFPTYGGLAGRDLEAIAVGLQEVVDEDYLRHRIEATADLANKVAGHGVPIVQPPGGHAVFLDARAFLPHIPVEQCPATTLASELYLEGGVRSVDIGSMTTGADPVLLVRLAIPRRVYTHSHLDYVAEVILKVWKRRDTVRGLRVIYQPAVLPTFGARFERVPAAAAAHA